MQVSKIVFKKSANKNQNKLQLRKFLQVNELWGKHNIFLLKTMKLYDFL